LILSESPSLINYFTYLYLSLNKLDPTW